MRMRMRMLLIAMTINLIQAHLHILLANPQPTLCYPDPEQVNICLHLAMTMKTMMTTVKVRNKINLAGYSVIYSDVKR